MTNTNRSFWSSDVARVLAAVLTVLAGAVIQSQGRAAALSAFVRIDGTVQVTPCQGSGFVVGLDRGVATIVTASHVIEGAMQFQVTFNADSLRPFPISNMVKLEARNQNGLAVFVVQGEWPSGVRPLQLAQADARLAVGDSAFLIGYPAMASTPRTLTRSGLGRGGIRYACDGGVDGGISDGPVVANGQAIGLITQTDASYAYAIPFTYIREILLGSGVSLSPVSDLPSLTAA